MSDLNEEFQKYKKEAYRLFAYTDYTVKGLYERLQKKAGADKDAHKEVIKRVILHMSEIGFLNERRYLDSFLLKLDAELLGKNKIKQKLQEKQFSEKHIQKALLREIDYEERAFLLILKSEKTKSLLQSEEGIKKLYAFLLRKGYTSSEVRGAINRARNQ